MTDRSELTVGSANRIRSELLFRKRLALFALFLGLVLFVGLLFAPYVMENLISPLALAAWLLLRIFVLSIGQEYYWWFFIFLGGFWLARRFLGGQVVVVDPPVVTPNNALKSVEHWRYIIHAASGYSLLRRELKQQLTQQLITLYSSRQRNAHYSEVFEPLLQRQIPLPEPVYAFLFTPDPQETQQTFLEKLRALPQAPRTWWRRWTGQEIAEYYQSIDAVLTFIETTLEVPYDDQPPRDH